MFAVKALEKETGRRNDPFFQVKTRLSSRKVSGDGDVVVGVLCVLCSGVVFPKLLGLGHPWSSLHCRSWRKNGCFLND